MKRGELRNLVRILADELTEAPEGLFTDVELDSLLNISQRVVQRDLANYIPWYFRKSKELSLTLSKKVYSISSDFLITDFLIFEKIVPNVLQSEARPLLYLEPKDIWLHEKVGDTALVPKGWGYETKDSVFFVPTPSQTQSGVLKAFYMMRIPDLNDDTSDEPPKVATPLLPEEAHQLLAIDTLRQWFIRDQSNLNDINQRYREILQNVILQMSMPGSIRSVLEIQKEPSEKK